MLIISIKQLRSGCFMCHTSRSALVYINILQLPFMEYAAPFWKQMFHTRNFSDV